MMNSRFPDPTQRSSPIPGIPGPAPWEPGQVENATPISMLPSAPLAPLGTEIIPMVQAGATVQMALNVIKAFVAPASIVPPGFVVMEQKPISTVNQIPPLTNPSNNLVGLLIINGNTFSLLDQPPSFAITGANITWLSTIFSVNPGDNVIAIYSSGSTSGGGGGGGGGSGTFAPIASPIFTGNPQAPTPSPGDNDQSLATTAFVNTAITAAVTAGVTSIDFSPTGLTPGPGANGDVTVGGILGVPFGGTGRVSNVLNGVLIGAGSNTIKASGPSPGNGALLIGQAGAVPIWLAAGALNQLLITSGGTPVWSTGVPGTTVITDAAAGMVGEVMSSIIPSGSAITLATATPQNVTSITLTNGDWDVNGEVWISLGTGGATYASGAITSNTGVLPGAPGVGVTRHSINTTLNPSTVTVLPTGKTRITVPNATTQPVYLVASATFPSGTVTAYGVIWARRPR